MVTIRGESGHHFLANTSWTLPVYRWDVVWGSLDRRLSLGFRVKLINPDFIPGCDAVNPPAVPVFEFVEHFFAPLTPHAFLRLERGKVSTYHSAPIAAAIE